MTAQIQRRWNGILPAASWPYVAIATGAVLASGYLSLTDSGGIWQARTPAVVLLELIYVGMLILSLAGWGAFIAARWRPADPPLRMFLCSNAIGWGIVAVLLLFLGLAGALNQAVAWALLAIGLVLGLARLVVSSSRPRQIHDSSTATPLGFLTRVVALSPLIVFGAVVLYGASLPPGLLWDAEGNGYDVLEYHLQVQREYYDAGRIHFLPHNVYASFPQQVEVLYLWLMHLRGGPYEAAIAAQTLHAAMAVLTLMVLAAWSPPGWGRITALLLAGGVPWLTYTGCLAYVENGLLYFTALAAALLVERLEQQPSPNEAATASNTIWLAGLCAGWAGAVKYTGLVLAAAALAASWFLCRQGRIGQRLRQLTAFTIAALLAVSPWLIRNAGFTGNPVHPFAYSVFGGEAWSQEQDEQWARGHALQLEQGSSRLAVAARETIRSELFGPMLWVVPIIGLILRRDRVNLMLSVWAVLMIVAWLTMTHMPGRFLIPLVVPLTLLASRAAYPAQARESGRALSFGSAGTAIAGLAFLGAIWTASVMLRILSLEETMWRKLTNTGMGAMVDRLDFMLDGQPLNHVSDAKDTRLWLVGPAAVFYVTTPMHYTVVFNRDPWLTQTAGRTPAEAVAWLQEHQVTHVAFDWAEIARLRDTYGFDPRVQRTWILELVQAGLRPAPIRDQAQSSARLQVLEVPR